MYSLLLQIKNAALSMGYEKCAIIKISDTLGYEEKLTQRIKDIPEAESFHQNLHRFALLHDTDPWAKSIVICVRQYGKYVIPQHLKGLIAKYYLTDSRIDKHSKDFQDSLKFKSYMQSVYLTCYYIWRQRFTS